ncbi:Anaphase-promoting complex subunit 13 [Purpureocillium lavendulum]|uniref:Anaphase-promoting complex subunit 13 n=1 Tax=Purpureocillium lavendulum TaxID=1247861 RepID=A0AB34FM03_9HYPO|nr:Anaphase-promoting complex subunit 13 [Purpureocillium lavendulum]
MDQVRNPLLAGHADSQCESLLYSKLPGEVRNYIFSLALADFPDPAPASQYAETSCYARPAYFAPRISDTRLLRTCRAVYKECWHLPCALREQVAWVTNADRAPLSYDEGQLLSTLRYMEELRGEKVEIGSLRVFTQMFMLERGEVAHLLREPSLHPREVTLTIRHTDWWHWEEDKPLYFQGDWIKDFSEAMPPSVRRLRIELESLERKKDQIDEIARQMAQRWCFVRSDGVVLYADAAEGAAAVSRWSGTSRLFGRRWVRDETTPGTSGYYIATVSFMPELVLERAGATVSETARNHARRGLDRMHGDRVRLYVPDAEAVECEEPSLLDPDAVDHFQPEPDDVWVEFE